MTHSKIWVSLLIITGCICSLNGCQRAAKSRLASSGPIAISVWHPWGGTMGEPFNNIVDEFNKRHPDIKVHPLFAPNNLSSNQKFFTAVAAGTPPDVIFVDGPQVAEWAERGALQPIDDLIERDGISEENFFGPCWRQNDYRGHIWALTFCADPNFGFVWNKKDFKDAGLNPDRPPQTLEELNRYADRLTKYKGKYLERIGIIPWAIYGSANSLFTWGWAFGGDFYDYENNKVTTNDPKIVKALEWMCSYAKKYDINRIASLQAGFGTAEQNPFYVGKLSMTCLHIAGINEIRRFAPGLEFGVTYLPVPRNGELHSSWVGGWCEAIPKGAKHREEAWEFIKWTCANKEGTTVMGKETGFFPAYRRSAYLKEVKNRKYYDKYIEILQECRHQRPVMPAQAYYMGALQRAVDYALYGQKTPKKALEDATIETQRELDLILAQYR